MLEAGEPAAEFLGTAADGSSISLRDFRGRPTVLYFYPKASSLGCSVEARAFAEHYAEFRARGIAVVGISVDSVEAQRSFAAECRLPFPLVADADGTIARRYGVLGALGLARRVTFFVDADGRIAEVVRSALPGRHVRRALLRLDTVRGAPPAGRSASESGGTSQSTEARPK